MIDTEKLNIGFKFLREGFTSIQKWNGYLHHYTTEWQTVPGRGAFLYIYDNLCIRIDDWLPVFAAIEYDPESITEKMDDDGYGVITATKVKRLEQIPLDKLNKEQKKIFVKYSLDPLNSQELFNLLLEIDDEDLWGWTAYWKDIPQDQLITYLSKTNDYWRGGIGYIGTELSAEIRNYCFLHTDKFWQDQIELSKKPCMKIYS